jgi:hypothetical protein
MLAAKIKVQQKEPTHPQSKIHYFESQITDCTPHGRSCRQYSPSFYCPANENNDESNIKIKEGGAGPRGKSLREQINDRLQQGRGKEHLASLSAVVDASIEPLSSIRKMLTEEAPFEAKKEARLGVREKTIQRQNRAKEQG